MKNFTTIGMLLLMFLVSSMAFGQSSNALSAQEEQQINALEQMALEQHGPTVEVPDARGSRAIGDDCSDPIQASFPGDLPYTDNNTTCGRGNNYANTALGLYDGGEDIIYEFTVTSDHWVQISMDPLGTTYTGIGLFEGCPDLNVSVGYLTGSSGTTVKTFTAEVFAGSTYYLMVDTWPSPTCIPSFDLEIIDATPSYTPVTSFPFNANFEDGNTPDEITPIVGANAIYDISADAAFLSNYGERHQGNTSSGWSNNSNPEDNFLDNPTHIISAQTKIIPSGGPGILTAKFMLKQTYTYNNSYYSNFRVTVNGTPVASEAGWTYRNGTDPSDEPFVEVIYDLSPWQNDAEITLALESANKYYAGYTSSYPWGDCSYIDDFEIFYLTIGDVEGYVYNSAGQTVSGAVVETEGIAPATTDGSGYYMLTGIPSGDVEISASKAGFNTITDIVTILPAATVTHDFTLTAPNINITPLIFDETLNPNEYLTRYLSLLNTGDGPLDFTAAVVYPSDAPALPNVQNEPVESTTNHSTGAIPTGIQPGSEVPAPVFLDGTRDGDNIAWISSPAGDNLYTMDMSTYATTLVGNSAIDPSSGDFMNGDASTLYVAASWGASLYSVDVATGAATMIAPITGGLDDVSGMACDRTTNTMYVSMTTISSSQIGTIDLTTGVITPIGPPTTVAPGLIDIAIDGSGQMYGWCLVTDACYLIDKSTGAFGSLGSLGFDANFGQGGNWNADDDVIYLTAFNGTAFQGQLRALDRVTGGTTMLSVLPELQMTAFGVPSSGGGGGVSGWLTLSDYSGSVPPAGGSFNIGVNFNAAGTVAGEVYHADIVIGTDPFVGQVTIPVTMTIAGDELPEITGFTAELTNAVTGQVTLSWDALREVTFEYFLIKRNGAVITTTTNTSYVDMLPAFGTYDYTVQPVFVQGQGTPAGPETVNWYEPALCWSPFNPENTQWTNTQQDVMLELENCNNGVLEFTFPDYAARALLSDPNVQQNDNSIIEDYARMAETPKGEADPRDGNGHPIVLGAGGPDNFGYVWIDSDEAGGPVYNWIDISSTGTLVTGLSDDNVVGPFPLSFDFPFYGVDKSQFWINSNGTIGFTSSYITLGNVQIPTTNSNKDFIAWFWDDLDPGGPNTSVYYEDFGTYMVIQFDHYNEYPDGNQYYIDAQLIMYQNGSIIINYDYIHPSMDPDGMTIGIQSSGADGLQVAYNTTYVHGGLALSFSLPAHFIVDVVPAYGTISGGQTMDVTMTYSSEDYGAGTYMEDLFITTNESPVNEWFIPNTMYVVEPASISGMVTDCNTGAPMGNVTITAVTVTKDLEDTFTAETGEDGNYMMYVNADTDYEVTASKAGFAPQMESVSVVMSAVVDFELCEEPYPVSQVWADPNEADTECLVTWTLPMGPYLIAYDNGTAEDYFAWTGSGGASAVKFTPAGYPATVEGGRIFVGDGSFPTGGNFLGTTMAVGVLDDDGAGGMPGTVMDSVGITVDNYGWVNFDGVFDVTFDDGNFYIVMWQIGNSPNVAPVGIDLEVPTVYRSYVKANGGEWMASVYNDMMIRAIVSGPGENVMNLEAGRMVYPGKLHPDTYIAQGAPNGVPGIEGTGEFKPVIVENADRDLVNYQLYRISGIDPENGIGVEDGVQTLIRPAHTTQQYNDVAWGGLDPGFYAYAVTATYENGDVSEMVFSNIAAHGLDNMVTLNISQCDGESPEGASVRLAGMNWPNQVLTATVDATGLVEFDSVINGYYNLMVTKDGYMDYVHNNIYLFDDYEETIVLQEMTYPARELVVAPRTSVATWKVPYAMLVENEGFAQGSDFPPAGWSETTQGDGWFHTGNGSSSFWTIPAHDGWYACVNDDANSGNNGCCDYLILPELDLSNTSGLLLQFDAFFSGAFSQLASVEYSLDGGASWDVAFNLPTSDSWQTYQVDLDALGGNASVLIAFHANDQGFWASGVAIDNVSALYGKEPAGYYVYLDGGFVAETASDVLTYTYQNLNFGQTYEAAVRALYSCGLSQPITYTFTSNFLYPPRNLGDEYVYGTNEVPLMWNPPMTVAGPSIDRASIVKSTAPTVNAEVDPIGLQRTVNGSRELWDIQFNFDIDGPSGLTGLAGAESDGEFVYATKWAGSEIVKFDVDGNYIETFSIPGVTGLRDLAYDGEYFYGAAAATTVYKMDFDSQTLVSSFTAPTAVRAIAYDSDQNGFWGNNWDSPLILFDESGATLDMISGPPSMYGAAFDDFTAGGPYLWVFTGTTTGGGCQIEQMEIATGALTGTMHSVSGDFGAYIAGGVYITENLVTGTRTIGGTAQGTPDIAFGYEIGPYSGGGGGGGAIPDGLMSFNVYRDGGEDPIANVPYDGEGTEDWITYVDNNMDPGCYDYTVTAVYDLGEYGFPGETAESDFEGPWEVCVVWGFELPFCETWEQGTFSFNDWATSENWVISSQEGNPAPAAKFNWDPLLEDGYSSMLTSAPFNADMLTEGSIWLDYEVALEDRNATGDEMLYVEVNDGSGWEVIDEFANDGSFDFTSRHVDISDYSSSTFKVRFNAIGENSFDIISWYVDNVCVYRTCDAPFNLTGEYVWNAGDDLGAEICWEAEVGSGGGSGEWLSYGSGPYVAGIGLNPIGPVTVAIEFDQDDLADYDGMEFSKMNFRYGNALLLGDVLVQIWENEVLILEETASGIDVNAWNEVSYNAPVVIDASKSYRIGYTVTDWDWNPDGPMGAQDFTGSLKSDLVLLDGAWDNLSNYLPYSWLLEAFVSDAAANAPVEHIQLTSSVESTATAENLVAVTAEPVDNNVNKTVNRALTSFMVYRSDSEMGEYTMIATVDAEAGVTNYCLYDTDVNIQTGYYYKVMAVYTSEDDMCESAFATAMENPLDDFVYVFVTASNDPLEASTILYPNPASDFVKIVSGQDITQIRVINYVGQMVYDSEKQGGQSVTLNTGSYEAGVYVVRITTTNGVVTKRMVITR